MTTEDESGAARPLPAFANGLAFGAFWGGLLSLVSSTAVAALCFGLARALGRSAVQGLIGNAGLELADRWFAWGGLYAVLVVRLVPIVSFDVISYDARLTRIGFCGCRDSSAPSGAGTSMMQHV